MYVIFNLGFYLRYLRIFLIIIPASGFLLDFIFLFSNIIIVFEFIGKFFLKFCFENILDDIIIFSD